MAEKLPVQLLAVGDKDKSTLHFKGLEEGSYYAVVVLRGRTYSMVYDARTGEDITRRSNTITIELNGGDTASGGIRATIKVFDEDEDGNFFYDKAQDCVAHKLFHILEISGRWF